MEARAAFDEYVWPLLFEYAPRVVGLFVALFAAWIVAGLTRKLVRRGLERIHFDETLTKFFSTVSRYVVLTIAVVSCLGMFGIQTASFAAVIAAAGLAIGLAFQGTLSNFASGVMLLAFRPFKVGDVIKVADEVGKVDEIEIFTTSLVTFDNRRIILPNGVIFGSKIENITHFPTRRCDVKVGVAYAADLDETRRVLEGAVRKTEGILDEPAFQIYLLDLGASSVDFAVRAWVKSEDLWGVREQLLRNIKRDLDAANIGIPFPQMDVHFDDPALQVLSSLRGKNVAQARA